MVLTRLPRIDGELPRKGLNVMCFLSICIRRITRLVFFSFSFSLFKVGMEAFSVGQLHRSDNGSFCLGGQVVQRDAASGAAASAASALGLAGIVGEADTADLYGDQNGAWCGEGWQVSFFDDGRTQ